MDTLKIDRSFLVDVPEREDAASIVASIIYLARGLGLETVAEGVETEGQHRFLRGCGCDLAQGFYLAAPMPSEAVGKLLRE